jgi:hypothetical protein
VPLAAGLVVTEAGNLGGIIVTAYTAPARLRSVHSLTDLAGRAAIAPVTPVSGASRPAVQVVVPGDSTAATTAEPGLQRRHHRGRDPRRADRTGHHRPAAARSGQEGVARLDRDRQHRRRRRGLVGPAAAVRGSSSCDNRASVSYFQKQLATFAVNYYQLLQQLASLPSQPRVIVSLYYDPFATSQHCLDKVRLDAAKERSLGGLLQAVNDVLAKGAEATSLAAVRPYFTGHQLCGSEPYVPGLKAAAPSHPTPAGELATALADEQALRLQTTPASPRRPLPPRPPPGQLGPRPFRPGSRLPGDVRRPVFRCRRPPAARARGCPHRSSNLCRLS